MRRFRFRLDPVLQYRKYLERLALMELAKTREALFRTQNAIRELERTRNITVSELGNLQAEGIKVWQYRIYAAYVQGLNDKIASENERLIEISQTLEEKHRAAQAQRTKKKTLECIRQNEYTEYIREINRAEQKMADELVTLRQSPLTEVFL